jgi:hypothetical protein
LGEAKLKLPCKDDRQDVKDDIVHDHNDRIRVEEGFDVDASSRSVGIPKVSDRNALEDDDQDAADAKSKSDELHEPDNPVMPTLICCMAIEEE